MRATAKKVKVEDLINGEYNRTPEGEPNSLTTPWEQEVLRVNLIATVVDKFVRDDGGYATLHLDDGTGIIRAKAWGDDVEDLDNYGEGDIVNVVGKVREYDEEIHVVPEIIRELDDPNWELVRELEILENRRDLLEEGIKPDIEEEGESEIETEVFEVSSEGTEESQKVGEIETLGEPMEAEDEEPQFSDEMKDKVLLALDKLEGEDGADISDLAAEVDEPVSKTEEILGVLLNEDKVYEPIAGKFKRL